MLVSLDFQLISFFFLPNFVHFFAFLVGCWFFDLMLSLLTISDVHTAAQHSFLFPQFSFQICSEVASFLRCVVVVVFCHVRFFNTDAAWTSLSRFELSTLGCSILLCSFL